MKHGNVLLLAALFTLLIISGGAKYYKYMVLRDYTIITTTACDPKSESCFTNVCDEPNCSEEPYKYIEKKAYKFSTCNPYEEECPSEACFVESGCTEILCSQSVLSEGERCINES